MGNSIESRRVEVLVDEAKSVAQWLDGESLLSKKWSHILIKSRGLKIFQIYVMMENRLMYLEFMIYF